VAVLACVAGCPRDEGSASQSSGGTRTLSWRGAGTKATLIAKAVEAIRANDPEAYSALIPSVAEMKRLCAERFKGHSLPQIHKRRQQTTRKVADHLARCATLVDWARAQQQEIWGGIAQPPLPGCRDKLQRLGDITVSFAVDKARYEVILENPFMLNGKRYGLLRAPSCGRAD
jgi:hypothetical protein